MRFAVRLSLVMLLSLGLVFPRVSVALAGLVGGARTVVLCDGVGLVTLVLDAQEALLGAADSKAKAAHERWARMTPAERARAIPATASQTVSANGQASVRRETAGAGAGA